MIRDKTPVLRHSSRDSIFIEHSSLWMHCKLWCLTSRSNPINVSLSSVGSYQQIKTRQRKLAGQLWNQKHLSFKPKWKERSTIFITKWAFSGTWRIAKSSRPFQRSVLIGFATMELSGLRALWWMRVRIPDVRSETVKMAVNPGPVPFSHFRLEITRVKRTNCANKYSRSKLMKILTIFLNGMRKKD